mmetsp:Transcript_138247/g.240373  ORF Transcript_138247/g.240373 Transcript_138247/m.240373 type:complete len:90 (-) Transcript_138247:122-391(-)
MCTACRFPWDRDPASPPQLTVWVPSALCPLLCTGAGGGFGGQATCSVGYSTCSRTRWGHSQSCFPVSCRPTKACEAVHNPPANECTALT